MMTNDSTAAATSAPVLDFKQILRTVQKFEKEHPKTDIVKHLFLSEEMAKSLRQRTEESPARVDALCSITVHVDKDPLRRQVRTFSQVWQFGGACMYEDKEGNIATVTGKGAKALASSVSLFGAGCCAKGCRRKGGRS